MHSHPLPHLVKAVEERILELQNLMVSSYGEGSSPQVKVFYSSEPANEIGTCLLVYDDAVVNTSQESVEVDDDPAEMDKMFRTYGVYHLTFDTSVLNDLKLPFVHNIVGHEFAHACVLHHIYMRKVVYNFMDGLDDLQPPANHGPEFKKFCRLFNLDPQFHKAHTTVGRKSAAWNEKHDLLYQMWCGCKSGYVTQAEYDLFISEHRTCLECGEVLLPYGTFVHPASGIRFDPPKYSGIKEVAPVVIPKKKARKSVPVF